MLKPIIYNPSQDKDLETIQDYLNSKSCNIVDQIENQIEELYQIYNPAHKDKSELANWKKDFFKTDNTTMIGIWVYFPWNNTIAHYLPEELHQELRTSRNKNLITKEQQQKFYNSTVAIAGLSVGNSALASLLYAGGFKNIRIADFDTLSASNINRIRTSFLNIGLKKTFVASKEIYEVNPYAQVQPYDEGLSEDNVEKFLFGTGKVDLIIEEMDNLYLKVLIRKYAKAHGIPIIMVTDNGDNIVVDVERYDLDSERRLFNTKLSEEVLLGVKPTISKHEAVRIISQLVGLENIANTMYSSLLELGKTLFTWPQLGGAAMMGGCVLSFCARKIILGEKMPDGKYLISPDEVFCDANDKIKMIKERTELMKEFKAQFHVE